MSQQSGWLRHGQSEFSSLSHCAQIGSGTHTAYNIALVLNLTRVYSSFWVSYYSQKKIGSISANSMNQFIFVMVKGRVFFEVRAKHFNI